MKLDVYETGISDHHKMIFSILWNNFAKGKPKIVFYRCYKKVRSKLFQQSISKQDEALQNLICHLKNFLRYLSHAFPPYHCVKCVHIRSYFWSLFSCIRTEYRKIRTRNNSLFGHILRSVIRKKRSDITTILVWQKASEKK